MEGCGSSGFSEFIRVKEEPAEFLPPPGEARDPEAAQVKVEQQNEQNSDSLKAKECVNEVKEELSCYDGVSCSVSEAAILAGLYIDHEVKDEVVLGLECPHRPVVNLVVDKRFRNCRVRLERLPSHDEHQTITQDTINHADLEFDEEEIGSRVDCEKEPICDLCGEYFALKSDLVKHVMQHIHVPSTKDESGQDVADYAFAGQCKQDLAQERALCRKYLVRDCCVRLERLHSDALLAGNQRATPATRTTIQGDTGSDTDDDTYHTVDCEKEPTCDICGKSFALQSDLKKHVMIHIHMPTAHDQSPADTIHSDRLSDTEEKIDISSTKRPPDTGEITMYVCDTCGKVYQQKYNLQLHIQNKHMPMTHKHYSCDACGQRFIFEDSLKIHIRAHNAEMVYSCNLCQRQFTTLPRLKRHRRVHTGAKLYSCKVCNKSLANKQTLVRHLRTHTPLTQELKPFAQSNGLRNHRLIHTGEKPYSCTICNKKFTQSSSLKTHKLIHTGEKPYSCTICNKKFTHSSSLWAHKLIHTGEKPYSCIICNKKFTRSSSLKTHKLIHTGKKAYSCTICSKRFVRSRDLVIHELTHTDERPYSCTLCNKRFKQSRNLKNHIVTHTGEKRYSCTICGNRFAHRSALLRHIPTHTEEHPYSCTICNKRFKTSISLNNHIDIHTGEQPFSCTICNKQFKRSSYLKRHRLIHTGEKPYTCTVCSKRFARSNDLVIHGFTHTEERRYSCTLCNKRFKQSKNLKMHVVTHAREKPFSCETCGKKFKTRKGLKVHIHTGDELYSCEICNKQYLNTNQLNRHKKTHVGYSFETFCKIERL